jgi:hypothetical protein
MDDGIEFHFSCYKAGVPNEVPRDSVGGSIYDANGEASFSRISLKLYEFPPEKLGIAYKCWYAGLDENIHSDGDWLRDGEWAPKVNNTADSAYISAFCIELTGELRSRFKVTYKASIVRHRIVGGKPDPVPVWPDPTRQDSGEDGSIVGDTGPIPELYSWIKEIWITISRI